MEELKQTIMVLLRQGKTPLEIQFWLQQLDQELTTTREYIHAFKEADFRP